MSGTTVGKSKGNTGRGVAPFLENDIKPGFNPVQNQVFGQVAEALRTGGVGAQIPIIQESVSQSRQALSDTLQNTRNDLGRANLIGTPYGQRTLAETRLLGGQQVAAIPTNRAQQIAGTGPDLVSGLLSSILGALSSRGKTHSNEVHAAI